MDCGAMLFETKSKMPALPRSLYNVASNTAFSAVVCGSLPTGLKSAAAMRTVGLLRLVPVCTQSCAASDGARQQNRQTKMTGDSRSRRFKKSLLMRGAILPDEDEQSMRTAARGHPIL